MYIHLLDMSTWSLYYTYRTIISLYSISCKNIRKKLKPTETEFVKPMNVELFRNGDCQVAIQKKFIIYGIYILDVKSIKTNFHNVLTFLFFQFHQILNSTHIVNSHPWHFEGSRQDTVNQGVFFLFGTRQLSISTIVRGMIFFGGFYYMWPRFTFRHVTSELFG